MREFPEVKYKGKLFLYAQGTKSLRW